MYLVKKVDNISPSTLFTLEHSNTSNQSNFSFSRVDLKQALLILECGTTHEAEKMKNNFINQQTFTPVVHG